MTRVIARLGTTSTVLRLNPLLAYGSAEGITIHVPAATPYAPDTSLRDAKTGAKAGPSPSPAKWLADVERRIRNSILPSDSFVANDGRWLAANVANVATSYFQVMSDILPSEPYIYSSRAGDLIAEFRAERGTMTAIVSATYVRTFATVKDEPPFSKKWPLSAGSDLFGLRKELAAITKNLRKREHGTVGS